MSEQEMIQDLKVIFKARGLLAALAEYAHDAWSGWVKCFFLKTVQTGDTVEIPAELVRRLKRQMETPYQDLPPDEQKSDMDEAEKIINILLKYI